MFNGVYQTESINSMENYVSKNLTMQMKSSSSAEKSEVMSKFYPTTEIKFFKSI